MSEQVIILLCVGICVGICVVSMMVNVGLVALMLKMYTEYFKDRSIAGRKP